MRKTFLHQLVPSSTRPGPQLAGQGAIRSLSAVLLGVSLAGSAWAGDFGCSGTCYNSVALALSNGCTTVLVKPGTYALGNVVTWTGTKAIKPGDSTCTNALALGTNTALFTAAAGKRAFVVDNSASLTVSDIHISAGAPNTGLPGGNIVVQTGATFIMTNGSLTDGTADTANGGCLAGGPSSTITLTGVTVSGCDADEDGGGISSVDGTALTLTDTTVTGNTAGEGGGVYINGTTAAVIQGDTFISENLAFSGGGITLSGGEDDATLTLQEFGGFSPEITDNEATSSAGGLDVIAGANNATVNIDDGTFFFENNAPLGGGILVEEVTGNAIVFMNDESTLSNNGSDLSTTIGGGLYLDSGLVYLSDDVSIFVNYASEKGAGIFVDELGTLTIAGSPITAPDDLDLNVLTAGNAILGGVQFFGNGSGDTSAVQGAAIYVDGGTVTASYLGVVAHGNITAVSPPTAVHLVNGAIFDANLSHYLFNEDVFVVESGSSLRVRAYYGEAGCPILEDDALDPLDFGFDGYCSEISANGHDEFGGRILTLAGEGSEATILTTGILWNKVNDTDVAVVVGAATALEFTTNMVGHNEVADPTTPMIVQVQDGGDFTAKQNTFADLDMPVVYEAGSTGDFRRNAAYDSGAGVAVEVDGMATVTGAENIGDWTGAISSGFANGTDPEWVTDAARGDFHLDINSNAVDICTIDGGFDVEGRVRPQPAGDWDAGAIELDQ